LPEKVGAQDGDRGVLQEEFDRAAAGFAERTQGRFDPLDPVGFSRLKGDAVVAEVGAGTGNFLSLFAPVARRLLALDLTHGMLREAVRRNDLVEAVQSDGARLPLASGSVDLIASAQAFHHIWKPVPVLQEMRRVMHPEGRLLLVDQVATESFEQIAFMNELEAIRDPSHATSRPPSAFRIIVRQAGLEIEDERVVEVENSFDGWMRPGEFPEDRITRVLDFIDRFGSETGMDFRREGDQWLFTRRRIMILARRA
jgi:SAM-dependent methyltransferase